MNVQEYAQFLASRGTGIGSSDIAALMGKDKYKTPLMVYRDKVDPPPATAPNNHMERGIQLEPVVANIVSKKLNRGLAHAPVTGVRHPNFPHVVCHPDRLVIGDDGLAEGLVEIKCPSLFAFRHVLENGVPEAYTMQLQYCMGAVGLSKGWLAVHCADNWTTMLYEVLEDPALQLQMYGLAEAFWRQHIDCRVPPQDETPAIPEADPDAKAQPLAGELLTCVSEYRQLQDELALLEVRMGELRTHIFTLAKGPGTFLGNCYRMNWALVKGKKSISKNKLIEAGLEPEDYMVEGTPYGRLAISAQEEV